MGELGCETLIQYSDCFECACWTLRQGAGCLTTRVNPLSADIDFEVLRRDICCDLDRDDLSELRHRDHLREGPQTRLSHPDSRPGETSRRCSRCGDLIPSTTFNKLDL